LAPVELSRSQVAALQYQTSVSTGGNATATSHQSFAAAFGTNKSGRRFRRDRAVSQRSSDGGTLPPSRKKPGSNGLISLPSSKAKPGLKRTCVSKLLQGRWDYTVGTEYRRQDAPLRHGEQLGVFL
jgi:hypothetical protein